MSSVEEEIRHSCVFLSKLNKATSVCWRVQMNRGSRKLETNFFSLRLSSFYSKLIRWLGTNQSLPSTVFNTCIDFYTRNQHQLSERELHVLSAQPKSFNKYKINVSNVPKTQKSAYKQTAGRFAHALGNIHTLCQRLRLFGEECHGDRRAFSKMF